MDIDTTERYVTTAGGGPTKDFITDVPDYLVAVNAKYLIPKEKKEFVKEEIVDEVVPVNDDNDDPDESKPKDSRDNGQQDSKKRPRDIRPSNTERLCHATKLGEVCPWGNQCNYSHDVTSFLNNKEPDLGLRCYQFDTFGRCPAGLMCRFGDCHIDKLTGKNLIRSVEDGGVIERFEINVLSKDAQTLMRKKKYDSKYQTNRNQDIADKDKKRNAVLSKDNIKDNNIASAIEDIVDSTSIPVVIEDSTPIITATEINTTDIDTSSTANVTINNAPPVVIERSTMAYPTKYVKLVDFSNKVYVAPLTTIGNLPFRRVLKDFGADITCGEMAMGQNLSVGQSSEWALLRRHSSEDVFGVQIAGNQANHLATVARMLERETDTDFVDLNCGCPIDLVCSRGAGSSLMTKPNKLVDIVSALTKNLSRTVTVKIRTGWDTNNPNAHKIVPLLQKSSKGRISAIFIHGRSRLQRYAKTANWDYILEAAQSQSDLYPRIPIIGNGDIFTYEDWKDHQKLMEYNQEVGCIGLSNCAMIGRGAIIKPWLPKEIKENRHIDISAAERMDMLKNFCNYGLEHWGSDQQGVNTTRRFLLEWLSFLHRYVPSGLVERTQNMQQRPPHYFGRCDMETLMGSTDSRDWVRISELLLGPVPDGFAFQAKHKSNSYSEESKSSI